MIKAKLWKITAALFAVFLSLPASPVCAEEKEGTSSVEVINHVETGAVTIQLHEYELDENGNEQKYEDNKIVVPEEEAYGANCIWVNDTVIVAEGYPTVLKAVQDLGYKTLVVDTSEYRKIDGGLSCLSLRF